MLICRPQEIVVVSTMFCPGFAGFADEAIVHELIPTWPTGTEITVGVCTAVVDVVEDAAATVVVVLVAVPTPTTSVKRGLTAKLYESPVQVPPNGLSRPYAYIWYEPAIDGAVTVTVNVAVRRSADNVGPRYTPLIHGELLTM